MDIKQAISELSDLPHMLYHKDGREYFMSPIKMINDKDKHFFYNTATGKLYIFNENGSYLNIISSTSDIAQVFVDFSENGAIEKIIEREKRRPSEYANSDLSKTEVSEILSDFLVFDKSSAEKDPLSKLVNSDEGTGYMSLNTNQVVVHHLKDNEVVLATSSQLAIILSIEKLSAIKVFINCDLNNELNLENKVSKQRALKSNRSK